LDDGGIDARFCSQPPPLGKRKQDRRIQHLFHAPQPSTLWVSSNNFSLVIFMTLGMRQPLAFWQDRRESSGGCGMWATKPTGGTGVQECLLEPETAGDLNAAQKATPQTPAGRLKSAITGQIDREDELKVVSSGHNRRDFAHVT
jgi:hypothetical protein